MASRNRNISLKSKPYIAPQKNISSQSFKVGRVLFIKGRPCNTIKSRQYPNAYTKKELYDIALKELGFKKEDIIHLNKDELCKAIYSKSMLKRKSPASKPSSISRKKTEKKKDCISRSEIPLNPQQVKIAKYMEHNRGLILVWKTGSGKTLGAITASQCVLDEHPRMRILVVTPKSLQESFKEEMLAYGLTKREFDKYTFTTPGVFLSRHGKDPTLSCGKDLFLIIDEAHNYRNKESKKSKAITQCAQQAGKVLLLTATPIYNQPTDIMNLMTMIKGERKIKTIDDFNDYFKNAISFYSPQYSKDYPSFNEYYVKIPMTEEYYEKYHRIEKELLSLGGIPSDPWIFYTGLRQATLGLDPCQKCDWVLKQVLSHPKSYKIVIFSTWKRYGVKKMENLFAKHNISWVEITGEMTKYQRNDMVKIFNSTVPGSPQVLFITTAGGEGLDLKGVRMVIIMDSVWTRSQEKQIIGRAIRFKSHAHLPLYQRNVTVYYLLLTKPPMYMLDRDDKVFKSSDEILFDIAKKKDEINKKVIRKLKELSI